MDNPVSVRDLLAVVVAIISSGGFWAWYSKRTSRKSAINQLLLGLAHDRIIHLGMSYIERGSITKDEYENLEKIFGPYFVSGGNGLAEKIMTHVKLLPMSGPDKTRFQVVKEHDPNEPHSAGQYRAPV